MLERHRVIADLELGRAVGGGVHAGLGQLFGLGGGRARRRGSRGQPIEIPMRELLDARPVEMADQHGGEVAGRVGGVEVTLGVGDGGRREVGRPAEDRRMVRLGAPEQGVELALQAPPRRRRVALPLLLDRLALVVQVTEDGSEQAVGLQPEPQLDLVRRQRHEVRGEVVAGEGVQIGRAGAAIEDVQLVGIRDPEGAGALEHHVFEQVAGAGRAGRIVGRADAGHPAGGHPGRVGTLDEQEGHAVGEAEGPRPEVERRAAGAGRRPPGGRRLRRRLGGERREAQRQREGRQQGRRQDATEGKCELDHWDRPGTGLPIAGAVAVSPCRVSYTITVKVLRTKGCKLVILSANSLQPAP